MRTAASGALSALASQSLMVVWLVRMDLDASVYLSTSVADVSYGGHTWLGAGAVGGIEAIDDTSGERRGLKFTLSSVPTEYLSLALNGGYRGKPVRVYEAIVGDAGVIDAPLVWSGSLNQMAISEGQISVTAEHRGATFARAKPLRYTDGDQQRLHTGDRSMQFVVSQANHVDVWPSAAFFKQ